MKSFAVACKASELEAVLKAVAEEQEQERICAESGIEPNHDEHIDSTDNCYLAYVEGYLACTYNHKPGEDCLMDDRI